MKPCYLELCGINSFSEPAVVDFTRLLEFGIFGVFGDTGSGKSTILDCIGFALYGNVFRSRSGSIADILNNGLDKAYVNYEFEIVYESKRRRFRIERELKRKNAAQSVKVYEREGETLHVLSDGVKDSNALLERIIGLEQKDFEKCIALPQGEFAQFVKAARSDRLKLVSRLFDLEEYGDKLTKKVNTRSARLKTEREVLEAKLEPYATASEEGLKNLSETIQSLQEQEKKERESLEALRKEEKSLSELFNKKREAERTAAELQKLEEQRPEIERLERGLGQIGKAQTVSTAAQELIKRRRLHSEAERSLVTLREKLAAAEEQKKKFAAYDDEKESEEIAKLTERKARAEQAEERAKKAEELNRKLISARHAYAEEAAKFQGFAYDDEKAEIEERLKSLGEGNFFDYLKEHGKSALFKSEYLVFADELSQIQNKYPETEEDVLPLVRKYGALAAGDENFEDVKRAYEERERLRGEANKSLLELEKKNGLYRTHRERLQQLQTEGVRLKEELKTLEEASAGGETLSCAELEKALQIKRRQRKEILEGRENALREHTALSAAVAGAEEKALAATENLKTADDALKTALEAGGFATVQEAEDLLKQFGSPAEATERIERFRERYTALCARKKELEAEDLSLVSEQKVLDLREKLAALEKALEETVRTLAIQKDAHARYGEALEKKRELEKELSKVSGQAAIYERLKKLLEGNKFMEFAAEEYLQNIAEGGSRRLLQLTSGRYFLRYDGGFFVGDNLAGGKLRAVYTLSGGETFLVSLSLALALSAEICFKSLRPIEFFFLDEGFGTLDERLVDVVMDSLEKLKGEHFSIGIISHVEELKHRIERKLLVEKATDKHGSRIIAN